MSISLTESATSTAPAPDAPSQTWIDPRDSGPVRAELFGLERLEAHGRQLASACVLAPPRRQSSPLLRRFAENGRFLIYAHGRISGAADQRGGRGLDAEWLADNFHIIEDVLREVRHDLPRGYDQELPKLSAPPLFGYPRVYALALSLVAHTDGELDEARITHFARGFQGVAPLTIGELWALPTMLRLVLLENLRRLAEQMLWGWDERGRAERWVAESRGDGLGPLMTGGGRDGRTAATSTQADPTDPFVVRLLQLLRDQGPSATAALGYLEDQLRERGTDASEILHREHRRQAANQVSVANSVISLRVLSALDWNTFFEQTSLVESALHDDPSGVYPRQDFATRDRYRQAVEKIARRSSADELSVARHAVELARGGSEHGPAQGHIGYYLVGRGQAALEAEFGYRPEPRERLLAGALRHPCATYFGSIAALLGVLLVLLAGAGLGSWRLALVLAASLLPASELAVGLVNHLLTLLLPPRVLPKLDFKEGIPADCATFVVMPSMIVRPQSAAALLERLEIHYLANPDPQLRFALLTDFADAPQEHMPEDDGYVRDALARVGALNERYGGDGPDKFFLFHRRRLWNPSQGCWMGWERKRGKLSEFNRLLRGDRGTSYSVLSADPACLPHIRFVITLDADTQMPQDTAGRLVGTLAHPLNRPRFDPARGRVVAGHGVLQPRVSFHLTAATHSRFAALLAASGGIDPYSTAASDAYMDLFGLGSFTGKGIYDVDAFEAATGDTFPENHILSHDLIEGNYARCGLLNDTELFDDFPARYHAYARREHRWVRGDWQLLPWLGRRVPAPEGRRENPLPALERWKLFDNLRRSLVPPALVVLLASGWTVLPGSPWLWTAVALAVPALPLLQLLLGTLVGSARNRSLAGVKRWRDTAPAAAGQALLGITFLAGQARVLVDAIVRTLVRLFVTRRNLLEWETAAATERRLGTDLSHFARTMWPAPALALVLTVLVGLLRPSALRAAGPVLAAWLLAPLIAFWVSRPRPADKSPLTDTERRALRRVARRTWHFFETFVGDADHWLPPDNYQELPDGRVAHRTSPTNQGLLLLSTLAAHDLGYIGLRALAERLEKTFDTFDRLEKHWGHFYNWYDTRTLKPMPPAYISTVDSGNLLGCLVALKQGLREKTEGPLLDPRVGQGLADTFGLAAEALGAVPPPAWANAAALYLALGADFERIWRRLDETPGDLCHWDEWLGDLDREALEMLGRVRRLADTVGSARNPLESWARRFAAQIQEHRADLAALAPWLAPLRAWEKQVGERWTSAEAVGRWHAVRAVLVAPPGLATIADRAESLREELTALEASAPAADGLRAVAAAIRESAAADLVGRFRRLGERADAHAAAMDFRPLYLPMQHLYTKGYTKGPLLGEVEPDGVQVPLSEPDGVQAPLRQVQRHLYTIGFNLAQERFDKACYDLLASESCLTSVLTIARGDAHRRHWFQLGRPFIHAAGRFGLMSWGGTMFEYLMPRLLLRSLPGTLVAESCRTAVARQIEYGREMGVPWGISESAFNDQYVDGDYRYQSFGVPGLGLKRGLDQDLVVAPYATALAAMIVPREALENFRRLTDIGAEGPFGFYEAIDFTRQRVPEGRRSVVVPSYMAHHQGMILVALANALLDDPMPRRFHAEPMVRAVELLLQERIPRDAPVVAPPESAAPAQAASKAEPLLSRRLNTPATPAPRTHLLSNTDYHVMLTNAGSGYSTCRGLDVTRWREDSKRDEWGQFCYVRDVERGFVWSAGHQPVCRPAEKFEVIFAADKAAFRRLDADVETLLEVTVSPEQPAEVRRVTLTNQDSRPRVLELTSYAEVVLGPRGADLAHPAFGNLFLESEWVPGPGALLCRRRPRSDDQRPIWAVHVATVDGAATGGSDLGEVQYETDRARFLGRGRTPADPAALDPGAVLSGTTGPVLNPILSLRRRVRLEPGGSVAVVFITAVTESRDEALALADQYREPSAAARAFDLAWAHSLVEHRQRVWSPEDVYLFQRLASRVIFAGSALRADPSVIAANRQGPSELWRYGISGDRPIVLARIAETGELPLARQLLAAHSYLRLKGLDADLVLLNEEPTTYFEELNQQLQEAVRASGAHDLSNKPGGVFVRKAAQMSDEDKTLLEAAARVVLVGDRGSLSSQLDRVERARSFPGPLAVTQSPGGWDDEPVRLPSDLLFPNGLGGFTPDGREYCLLVRGLSRPDIRRNGTLWPEARAHPILPPAPWVNVVANPAFGFLVSEGGSGFTWAGNSQTNRLTPWSNDPVSDPPGEVVYLRDEASGEVWTPTLLPILAADPILVRHGQGYTTFERNTHGLAHEFLLFVPPEDPVKLIRLRVRNPGSWPRRLSATFFAEWVLGTTRDVAAMHVVTECDPETGALLARNAFRTDFAARVAFADVGLRPRTMTADRAEFLGRHGSVAAPAALTRLELSGRVGAVLDPCVALQVKFELGPGADQEIVFLLGEAEELEAARSLLRRYSDPDRVGEALDEVKARWSAVLEAVQVRTPSPAFDLLLNRWLLYQVLSCRVWARSAFYQSGGAYGFRDQLQDVMALIHGAPGEARGHILRASARQFLEGDVQHWWHPPAGRGVRTRCSDDFLWLPFVVSHYLEATGDAGILDERVPFLRAPLLKPGQEDSYGLPAAADEDGTVYDHCVRALENGMRLGPHGLPLMRSGDWNDGMNRVGAEGKGESVWVAWFLLATLRRFTDLAAARGDGARADRCRAEAESLRSAVEAHGWDGGWYRRAYCDDGTPLGSTRNDECQIDSIAQTWAVISGAADPDRALRALAAVNEHLVRHDDRLVLLLAPPFDEGPLDPGYIKGYPPGIRENGGQYTHAATWVVQAAALLGQGETAFALFELLNPIHHTDCPEAVDRYKVEPYVVAADVYSRPPHVGRGGWTWYTGSAAWLYRVGLESILGFRTLGDQLILDPCIPHAWPRFEITCRYRTATYQLVVENPEGVERGVCSVSLDGQPREGSIALVDDGRVHEVRILMGKY